jgi:predicted deacylase
MIDPQPESASEPRVVSSTSWVRADSGGFLQFHVSPGDVVDKEQILATNYGLLGKEQESVYAPFSGIVIGMSTMPAVAPGDPVLHLAKLPKKEVRQIGKEAESGESADQSLREDLATNIHVVEAPEETP